MIGQYTARFYWNMQLFNALLLYMIMRIIVDKYQDLLI